MSGDPSGMVTRATIAPAADTAPAAIPLDDVPSASTAPGEVPATPRPEAAAAEAGQRIVVATDVLRVEIDTRGGNVVVNDLGALQASPDTGCRFERCSLASA